MATQTMRDFTAWRDFSGDLGTEADPYSRQRFAALRPRQCLRNSCDKSFGENHFHGFKASLR